MTFIFKQYGFINETATAWFEYAHDNGHSYREEIQLQPGLVEYNTQVFERALFLSFLLVGTSYYKCFPSQDVVFEAGEIDEWQALFLNKVYQEGLSQFAFENQLTRQMLAQFSATTDTTTQTQDKTYNGDGVLALQSGGKDSLLVAQLLEQKQTNYSAWYVTNGPAYPHVLDRLDAPMLVARRSVDTKAIRRAIEAGGKNGHVPVTYIVLSFALLQSVLLGKSTVLAAIAHEGDEAHEWIDDLPVNHQWSKTWQAEQLIAEYVAKYVSTGLQVGSPLRNISELKLTELFAQAAWNRFSDAFSSCNVGNYQQGADNTTLVWCGECPKCANAYLLFAPFVAKQELDERLGGDLLSKPTLQETFKGLLGIDGVMKPFECIGEVDELRLAYQMALECGYTQLPFAVPASSFDKDAEYDAQAWATAMVQ